MSNSKLCSIKGAEIRKLADMCSQHLRMIDPHGFGVCWEYDAEKVNKVAEILGIPYRVSNKCDTRVGPELEIVKGGLPLCVNDRPR